MSRQQAFQGRVTGRVQGVFFRAETRAQAQTLGLVGWVRNCEDGTVEFVIAGEETALQTMRQWLAHGPQRARVEALELAPCEFPDLTEFSIRR